MDTNADLFIQWTRIDEPGDQPTWESQCGLVEQIGFGNCPCFQGFMGPDKIRIKITTTTFNSMKKLVEREYQKSHTLKWEYEVM